MVEFKVEVAIREDRECVAVGIHEGETRLAMMELWPRACDEFIEQFAKSRNLLTDRQPDGATAHGSAPVPIVWVIGNPRRLEADPHDWAAAPPC